MTYEELKKEKQIAEAKYLVECKKIEEKYINAKCPFEIGDVVRRTMFIDGKKAWKQYLIFTSAGINSDGTFSWYGFNLITPTGRMSIKEMTFNGFFMKLKDEKFVEHFSDHNKEYRQELESLGGMKLKDYKEIFLKK